MFRETDKSCKQAGHAKRTCTLKSRKAKKCKRDRCSTKGDIKDVTGPYVGLQSTPHDVITGTLGWAGWGCGFVWALGLAWALASAGPEPSCHTCSSASKKLCSWLQYVIDTSGEENCNNS